MKTLYPDADLADPGLLSEHRAGGWGLLSYRQTGALASGGAGPDWQAQAVFRTLPFDWYHAYDGILAALSTGPGPALPAPDASALHLVQDAASLATTSDTTLLATKVNGTNQQLGNYIAGRYSMAGHADFKSFNLSDTGVNPNSGTIYYSTSANFSDKNGIGADHAALVDAVFTYLGNLTGINFVKTFNPNTSDIDFTDEDWSGAYTLVYSVEGQTAIDHAVVNVSPDWNNVENTLANGYLFQTFLHETLHALGLGHLGPYNVTGGYEDSVYTNDSWLSSVMSYVAQAPNPYLSYNTTVPADFAFVQTAMVADIVALDTLYAGQSYAGKQFGTQNAFATDTVYGVNTTVTAAEDPVINALSAFADTNAYCIVDGGGADTFDFSGWSANQSINLAVAKSTDIYPTISSVGGGRGNLTIAVGTVIENAIGGSGNDVIRGNAFANRLEGGDGSDLLDGNTGTDTLVGGAGNDIFYTDGGDTLIEVAGGGFDTVRALASHVLGADFEALQLLGTAALNGTGNALDNRITGNAGANILDGGGGTDVLIGGAGNDIYVTDGGDTISEKASEGIDTVRSSVSYVLGANLERLELTGSTATNGKGNTLANRLTGNAAANVLNGGSGNDTLIGADGNDRLLGSSGKDYLYGGLGADQFVFRSTVESSTSASYADVISDFTRGKDKIDLSAIDAFAATATNNAYLWRGTATGFTSSTAGEVRYHKYDYSGTASDYTLVFLDTDADSSAEMCIRLKGLFNLTATDFIL